MFSSGGSSGSNAEPLNATKAAVLETTKDIVKEIETAAPWFRQLFRAVRSSFATVVGETPFDVGREVKENIVRQASDVYQETVVPALRYEHMDAPEHQTALWFSRTLAEYLLMSEREVFPRLRECASLNELIANYSLVYTPRYDLVCLAIIVAGATEDWSWLDPTYRASKEVMVRWKVHWAQQSEYFFRHGGWKILLHSVKQKASEIRMPTPEELRVSLKAWSSAAQESVDRWILEAKSTTDLIVKTRGKCLPQLLTNVMAWLRMAAINRYHRLRNCIAGIMQMDAMTPVIYQQASDGSIIQNQSMMPFGGQHQHAYNGQQKQLYGSPGYQGEQLQPYGNPQQNPYGSFGYNGQMQPYGNQMQAYGGQHNGYGGMQGPHYGGQQSQYAYPQQQYFDNPYAMYAQHMGMDLNASPMDIQFGGYPCDPSMRNMHPNSNMHSQYGMHQSQFSPPHGALTTGAGIGGLPGETRSKDGFSPPHLGGLLELGNGNERGVGNRPCGWHSIYSAADKTWKAIRSRSFQWRFWRTALFGSVICIYARPGKSLAYMHVGVARVLGMKWDLSPVIHQQNLGSAVVATILKSLDKFLEGAVIVVRQLST